MTVTSAKYTENGSIEAVIDGVEMWIPDDMSNGDRQTVAEWEKDNTIAPYVPPPLPEHYVIPKSLPWLRMTDAEADAVMSAMAFQSPRFRMIYDAVTVLDTASELFPTLKSFLSATLTPERAEELLARE